MFVRRKKNRSGSVSVVVAEKYMGRIKELITIGIAKSDEDVVRFSHEGLLRNKIAVIQSFLFLMIIKQYNQLQFCLITTNNAMPRRWVKNS